MLKHERIRGRKEGRRWRRHLQCPGFLALVFSGVAEKQEGPLFVPAFSHCFSESRDPTFLLSRPRNEELGRTCSRLYCSTSGCKDSPSLPVHSLFQLGLGSCHLRGWGGGGGVDRMHRSQMQDIGKRCGQKQRTVFLSCSPILLSSNPQNKFGWTYLGLQFCSHGMHLNDGFTSFSHTLLLPVQALKTRYCITFLKIWLLTFK